MTSLISDEVEDYGYLVAISMRTLAVPKDEAIALINRLSGPQNWKVTPRYLWWDILPRYMYPPPLCVLVRSARQVAALRLSDIGEHILMCLTVTQAVAALQSRTGEASPDRTAH